VPRIDSNYIFAALGLAGTGAIVIWPDAKWIGWGFIAIAVIVLVFGIRISDSHFRIGRPRMNIYFILMGIGALVFVGALAAYLIDRNRGATVETEPKSIAPAPAAKPSEPAPSVHEKVESAPKPIPRKDKPPVTKKDVTIEPKEIIPEKPDKPIETAPIEATPIQPKEKIADILIRKCPPTDPALERRPKFFLQEWLNVINDVNDRMTKHDLQTVLKVRPRLRDHISENAHLAEAISTLRCLESEGYMRTTETPERIMGLGYPVVYNLEFEFVPERLDEFKAGL
jgi:hypothetical protein